MDRDQRTPSAYDRVWTIPNALSMARLIGVPVFLVLILRGHDGWALLVLMVSGATDYVDGWLARRFGQVTRLGQALDPVADRLYILSTLLAFLVRGVLPWWFVAALLLRDLVGTILVRRVRRVGYRGMPVNFVGKAATFNLLYAFPLLLFATWQPAWESWVLPFAWAFAWWGLLLYWVAFVVYVAQARAMIAAATSGAEGTSGEAVTRREPAPGGDVG